MSVPGSCMYVIMAVAEQNLEDSLVGRKIKRLEEAVINRIAAGEVYLGYHSF